MAHVFCLQWDEEPTQSHRAGRLWKVCVCVGGLLCKEAFDRLGGMEPGVGVPGGHLDSVSLWVHKTRQGLVGWLSSCLVA